MLIVSKLQNITQKWRKKTRKKREKNATKPRESYLEEECEQKIFKSTGEQ